MGTTYRKFQDAVYMQEFDDFVTDNLFSLRNLKAIQKTTINLRKFSKLNYTP